MAAGCGDRAADGEARIYEMRGVVRTLPAGPGEEIWIRHEPLPEFVDLSGRQVGMPAMTMSFALATGIDLGGIEPGQKVELTLEVAWERSPPARIVALKPLPPDTPLRFD